MKKSINTSIATVTRRVDRISVLWEDDAILVCCKPVGFLSESDANCTDPVHSLPDALCVQQHLNTLYAVHRLDRPISGVMVYAKTTRAAAALSAQLQKDRKDTWEKEYLAVVCGIPTLPFDEWKDYLYRDRTIGKAFVSPRPRSAAKEARLSYQVLQTITPKQHLSLTLVRVRLYTGRFHQIRAQFASRGMPIAGDGKYGSR